MKKKLPVAKSSRLLVHKFARRWGKYPEGLVPGVIGMEFDGSSDSPIVALFQAITHSNVIYKKFYLSLRKIERINPQFERILINLVSENEEEGEEDDLNYLQLIFEYYKLLESVFSEDFRRSKLNRNLYSVQIDHLIYLLNLLRPPSDADYNIIILSKRFIDSFANGLRIFDAYLLHSRLTSELIFEDIFRIKFGSLGVYNYLEINIETAPRDMPFSHPEHKTDESIEDIVLGGFESLGIETDNLDNLMKNFSKILLSEESDSSAIDTGYTIIGEGPSVLVILMNGETRRRLSIPERVDLSKYFPHSRGIYELNGVVYGDAFGENQSLFRNCLHSKSSTDLFSRRGWFHVNGEYINEFKSSPDLFLNAWVLIYDKIN
jgi:hypothetical protein